MSERSLLVDRYGTNVTEVPCRHDGVTFRTRTGERSGATPPRRCEHEDPARQTAPVPRRGVGRESRSAGPTMSGPVLRSGPETSRTDDRIPVVVMKPRAGAMGILASRAIGTAQHDLLRGRRPLNPMRATDASRRGLPDRRPGLRLARPGRTPALDDVAERLRHLIVVQCELDQVIELLRQHVLAAIGEPVRSKKPLAEEPF